MLQATGESWSLLPAGSCSKHHKASSLVKQMPLSKIVSVFFHLSRQTFEGTISRNLSRSKASRMTLWHFERTHTEFLVTQCQSPSCIIQWVLCFLLAWRFSLCHSNLSPLTNPEPSSLHFILLFAQCRPYDRQGRRSSWSIKIHSICISSKPR